MLQRYTIVFVLLLCNCSSTPVKKQNVILAKDYKHYITLKDQQERKTIPQKLKEIFKKKKPQSTNSVVVPPKSSRRIIMPRRRLRQTNTNEVSLAPGDLMLRTSDHPEVDSKSKSNISMYFIYMQAIIICVLSIYVYWKYRRKASPKQKPERKLNL
tara:strand:- start:1053 stop:1520 length:468 start_codon:yes stop_codon:yes gene_type:complete